jgi:protein SCO1/2
MNRKYSIWFFVLVIVLLPVIAFAVVSWYEKQYRQLPVFGGDQHIIADFKMTNQKGNVVTNTDWQGKIVIVDFFFTHCVSICPKMTNSLKTVQQQFLNDNSIVINSFTVDPENDSVRRLAAYASQSGINNDNWNLLTGLKTDIYRLARKSFLIVAADGDGGPNDFIHSSKLELIDQKKQIRGFYDGTNEQQVTQLIKDIRKLQNEFKKR